MPELFNINSTQWTIRANSRIPKLRRSTTGPSITKKIELKLVSPTIGHCPTNGHSDRRRIVVMAIARPRRAVKPQLCAATAPKGAGLGPRMRGPSDHPYMASSDDFPKGRVSDLSIERPGFRRRRDMGPLMVASCCRLDEPNLNRQCKNIGCGGCHLCAIPYRS